MFNLVSIDIHQTSLFTRGNSCGPVQWNLGRRRFDWITGQFTHYHSTHPCLALVDCQFNCLPRHICHRCSRIASRTAAAASQTAKQAKGLPTHPAHYLRYCTFPDMGSYVKNNKILVCEPSTRPVIYDLSAWYTLYIYLYIHFFYVTNEEEFRINAKHQLQ